MPPPLVNVNAEVEEEYLNHFMGFLEKNNFQGLDYLEFANLLHKQFEKFGNTLTETQLFEMGFMSFDSQGITKQRLIDTANQYLQLIADHKKEFDQYLSNDGAKGVQDKVNESANLEKLNNDAAARIANLNQEIKQIQQAIANNTQTIQSNTVLIQGETEKLQIKQRKFEGAYKVVVEKITGVEFTLVTEYNGEKVHEVSKVLNLFSLTRLVKHLSDNLKTLGRHIRVMNYYRHFADNIDKELDDAESQFGGEIDYYQVGGDYAFFLGTKTNGDGDVIRADNNAAGKIIEAEYNKEHPENTVSFDPELMHCWISANNRGEAKRFMLWMDEHYFKPWVEAHLDGWDDFAEDYKNASEEDKQNISLLVNKW